MASDWSDGSDRETMMKRLAMAVATCCGAGYAPFAPGTVGAAAGLVPVLLLAGRPSLLASAAAALFLAGVAAGTAAERALGRKDPPAVVIDEAVSIMVTFAWVPLAPWALAAGFVLNRLFDIVKPFPADRLQALPGGWGIMMDDLVAGLYAHCALRLAWALLPHGG